MDNNQSSAQVRQVLQVIEEEPKESPGPVHEDAIDLTIEYSEARQALLWMTEYGGYLSCWSQHSINESIGGLSLAHMEGEGEYSSFSLVEYGINFDGFNYKTQSSLGQAVVDYLTKQGYQLGQNTLAQPDMVLSGLEEGEKMRWELVAVNLVAAKYGLKIRLSGGEEYRNHPLVIEKPKPYVAVDAKGTVLTTLADLDSASIFITLWSMCFSAQTIMGQIQMEKPLN